MTTTVTAAVAQRESGPVHLMWGRKNHFGAVLPDHIDVKSFLGTAAGALYADGDLMRAAESNPDSLIIALMECAALGHRPGTDEYYLISRKIKGRPTVQGIEGYRGIVERMYRSGAVSAVIVREVCAADYFHYIEGVDAKPLHRTGGDGGTGADFFGGDGFRDRGPMVGVYAYAILAGGAVSRVVLLNKADVHAARDAGGWKPDDQYSPWNRLDAGKDHPEFTGRSMWWKTAARRLEPWVPTSAEYRREQLRAAAAASAPRPAEAAPSPAAVPGGIADAEITDAEIVGEPGPQPEPEPEPGPRRGRQRKAAAGNGKRADPAAAIVMHFERLGISDREERLILTGRLAGLEAIPESTSVLSPQVAGQVLEVLSRCRNTEALYALTRDGDAPQAGDPE